MGAFLAGGGCATADTDTGGVVGGTVDTGEHPGDVSGLDVAADASPTDTRVASDTGTAKDTSTGDTTITEGGVDGGLDSTVVDTGATDTLVATDTFVPTDTFVGTDSAPTDTGVVTDVGGDGGPLGKVLVYNDVVDDFFGLPAPDTWADDAVVALGGTATLANTSNFNSLFDAKGFDILIIDAPYSALPSGADTRIVGWITGGNRILYAHWSLNTQTTIASALEVTPTTYSTWRNVHRDPASLVNLFAGKEAVPTPITGVAELLDNGDSLVPTASGIVAARLDSGTGAGAIVITKGGKAIVNGFCPFDARATDGDADGIKDMRELWENEIQYVQSH